MSTATAAKADPAAAVANASTKAAADKPDKPVAGPKGDKPNPAEQVPFRKLYRYSTATDYALIAVATLGACASGCVRPVSTVLFGNILNSFTSTAGILAAVRLQAIYYCYLGAGACVAGFAQSWAWNMVAERQTYQIRRRYLQALLRTEVAVYDGASSGELVGRLSSDIVLINAAMGEKVGNSLMNGSTFVAGMLVGFIKGWQLTLVILGCIPFLVASGAVTAYLLTSMSVREQKSYGHAGSVAQEVFSTLRTVAAFNGEERAKAAYSAALADSLRLGVYQKVLSGVGSGMATFVMYSTFAISLWYGTVLIRHGVLNGGTVMTVFFAVLMGGSSLGQSAPNMDAFTRARGAGFKIFQVIDRKPAIDAADGGETLPEVRGEISLRDVRFAYAARPDVTVLERLNLTVPAGKTVALVGESGSGKSTVIQLALRFYDPLAGSVHLDGVDVRRLDLRWLRAQCGLVSQEPVLFACSVRENLLYGKPDATDAELEAACRAANAHGFISQLADGYGTYVGERGLQLSGGQKQRVAIARAMLKDPRVLLLDEATSALDNESERIVQVALDNVMQGRTSVAVAHRLTTIRDADLICVMRRGVLVEQGSHDELVAQDGAYAALLRLQGTAPGGAGASVRRAASRAAALDAEGSKAEAEAEAAGDGAEADGSAPAGAPSSVVVAGRGEEKTAAAAAAQAAEEEKSPFWRLARMARPEAPFFGLGVVAAAISGARMPVFAVVISRLLNVFFERDYSKMATEATFWCLMMFMIGGVCLITMVVMQFCSGVLGQRLVMRVRQAAFAAALRQEIAFFDDLANSSGALNARLATDAALLRLLIADGVLATVQNLATGVSAIIIAFHGGWQLTLVMFGSLPLTFLSYAIAAKQLSGLNQSARALYERATQVATDSVSNIRTVASFTAEARVLALFDDALTQPMVASRRKAVVAGRSQAFAQLMQALPQAFAFYIGGIFISHGIMSFQAVMQVYFALIMAAVGASQVSATTGDVGAAKPAAVSVLKLMDRKPVIDAADAGGLRPASCAGTVALRDVEFQYPSRPGVPVLRGLTLEVAAGTLAALVGESGSGKSTVVQLLLRFYDPTAGAVFLDGQDLRQLNLHWLRAHVGVVSQEPALFATSLRENIAYGREAGATDAEVEAAAAAANISDFIAGLPARYATEVGERGVQLSGGQKQRVAIARAILKDPRVLLLDEATSALDNESERIVQAALDRLMAGRTTVAVAHRLSTIRHADCICVMARGVLLEQGTHEELASRPNGAYARMAAVRGEL